MHFRLLGLFLLMMALGIALVSLQDGLDRQFIAWVNSKVKLAQDIRDRQAELDRQPIAWVDYSKVKLEQDIQNDQVVLVTFGAEWDILSALVERDAINKPSVKRWIRSHGVIPVRGDYTNTSPEIESALRALNERGVPVVPVVAVYSRSLAGPIVLDGMITEKQLLKALAQAEAD